MSYEVVSEYHEHDGKFYRLVKVAGGDVIWQPIAERETQEEASEPTETNTDAPKRRTRQRKVDDAT